MCRFDRVWMYPICCWYTFISMCCAIFHPCTITPLCVLRSYFRRVVEEKNAMKAGNWEWCIPSAISIHLGGKKAPVEWQTESRHWKIGLLTRKYGVNASVLAFCRDSKKNTPMHDEGIPSGWDVLCAIHYLQKFTILQFSFVFFSYFAWKCKSTRAAVCCSTWEMVFLCLRKGCWYIRLYIDLRGDRWNTRAAGVFRVRLYFYVFYALLSKFRLKDVTQLRLSWIGLEMEKWKWTSSILSL